MFMRMLNDDQKRALLVLSYHLAMADHTVTEEEGDLLDELRNGLRTDVAVSPQQLLERPSLAVFDSRDTRVAVVLEILTLAYGDNAFPDSESRMVSKLAEDFGFSGDELERMKTWAQKNCALLDDALALMATA